MRIKAGPEMVLEICNLLCQHVELGRLMHYRIPYLVVQTHVNLPIRQQVWMQILPHMSKYVAGRLI